MGDWLLDHKLVDASERPLALPAAVRLIPALDRLQEAAG